MKNKIYLCLFALTIIVSGRHEATMYNFDNTPVIHETNVGVASVLNKAPVITHYQCITCDVTDFTVEEGTTIITAHMPNGELDCYEVDGTVDFVDTVTFITNDVSDYTSYEVVNLQ